MKYMHIEVHLLEVSLRMSALVKQVYMYGIFVESTYVTKFETDTL